jgi:hypothetical protein
MLILFDVEAAVAAMIRGYRRFYIQSLHCDYPRAVTAIRLGRHSAWLASHINS